MDKALIENLNSTNFAVLNSMDDWVRIIDPFGNTIFKNDSLEKSIEKSTNLQIYLKENIPLNLARENESIRNTTVIEEKLIDNRYYSIKASPIFYQDKYEGTVEVFRDITSETSMKTELFEANRSMLDDVRFVRKIQSSILPKDKKYANLNLKSIYLPTTNVSGDLYDIIKIDDDKYAFYIADVMGHGVKASILTMFVKVSISSIFEKNPNYSPSEALLKLRKKFTDLDIYTSQYFTAWLGIFDLKNHHLTFSNAGHNCPPMMVDKFGKFQYLHANGRMISNIIEPDKYNEISIPLTNDAKILFFTDGAVETENVEKKEFGLERLKNLFCKYKDLDKIYGEIKEFSYGEQKDDITLAIISYDKE